MGALLIIIGAFGLIALLSIYHGWILSIIWNWFVPLLGGPTISIPIAVGISCIVSMLTHSTDTDDEKRGERIAMMLIKPLILLFIAWFFHLFA